MIVAEHPKVKKEIKGLVNESHGIVSDD